MAQNISSQRDLILFAIYLFENFHVTKNKIFLSTKLAAYNPLNSKNLDNQVYNRFLGALNRITSLEFCLIWHEEKSQLVLHCNSNPLVFSELIKECDL